MTKFLLILEISCLSSLILAAVLYPVAVQLKDCMMSAAQTLCGRRCLRTEASAESWYLHGSEARAYTFGGPYHFVVGVAMAFVAFRQKGNPGRCSGEGSQALSVLTIQSRSRYF